MQKWIKVANNTEDIKYFKKIKLNEECIIGAEIFDHKGEGITFSGNIYITSDDYDGDYTFLIEFHNTKSFKETVDQIEKFLLKLKNIIDAEFINGNAKNRYGVEKLTAISADSKIIKKGDIFYYIEKDTTFDPPELYLSRYKCYNIEIEENENFDGGINTIVFLEEDEDEGFSSKYCYKDIKIALKAFEKANNELNKLNELKE
jgi:hypothetical protein